MTEPLESDQVAESVRTNNKQRKRCRGQVGVADPLKETGDGTGPVRESVVTEPPKDMKPEAAINSVPHKTDSGSTWSILRHHCTEEQGGEEADRYETDQEGNTNSVERTKTEQRRRPTTVIQASKEQKADEHETDQDLTEQTQATPVPHAPYPGEK
eukprot:gene9692-20146_t